VRAEPFRTEGKQHMTSTPIVVSGEIRINPEDFDAAMVLAEPLVAATLEEAGNVTYGFWVDPRDRGRVRIFEEWENEDAMAAHGASAHLATFFAGMAALRIESVELSRYDVSAKGPLQL
jgi:quinol monooxygenase YgiN